MVISTEEVTAGELVTSTAEVEEPWDPVEGVVEETAEELGVVVSVTED